MNSYTAGYMAGYMAKEAFDWSNPFGIKAGLGISESTDDMHQVWTNPQAQRLRERNLTERAKLKALQNLHNYQFKDDRMRKLIPEQAALEAELRSQKELKEVSDRQLASKKDELNALYGDKSKNFGAHPKAIDAKIKSQRNKNLAAAAKRKKEEDRGPDPSINIK